MQTFIIFVCFLVFGTTSSSNVEFAADCFTHLIHQHFGYNISCTFNISVISNSIYDISLNWSIPSDESFVFDNKTHFEGGINPNNAYHGSSLIAKWNEINESNAAILRLYLQPNTTISRNEMIISTATITYNETQTIAKSVMIQFSLPSNDAPSLYASSYSLSTNEDSAISTNVYVKDADFSELSKEGLMEVNISVINGTINLYPQLGGIHFVKGSASNSSDIQMIGSLLSVNESLSEITFVPLQNQDGNAQIIIAISDKANSGIGGERTDAITINVTIFQIYEIPKLNVPFAQIKMREDDELNLGQTNCSLTSDVDPNYGWLQLTVSVIFGNLSFDGNVSGININIEEHSIIINDTAQLLTTYFSNVCLLCFLLTTMAQ